MRTGVGLVVAGVVASASAVVWAVEVPPAVSPGRGDDVAVVESRCPTFDWGLVPGAESYELLVYRLGEEGEEGQEAESVLRQAVPGSASGWTPSVDRCLERGARYAWSIRAVGKGGASGWSSPSLFEVAGSPSPVEFERALAIVRSYLAERGTVVAEPTARPSFARPVAPVARVSSPSVASRAQRGPTVAGVPAFQAEQNDSTGVTFGVVGLTNSASGGTIGVYGEQSADMPEGQSGYGVLGFAHGVDSIGVFGQNRDVFLASHPDRFHGIGVKGSTAHDDGVGVLGEGGEDGGVGVVGTTLFSAGIGVQGLGLRYGGFFESPGFDLIGADKDGDLVDPDFRVDNSGKVFATAIDLGAFGNTTRSNAGGTTAGVACVASELMVGGGCECGGSGNTLVESIPNGSDAWLCQCSASGATAWVVCLESQ